MQAKVNTISNAIAEDVLLLGMYFSKSDTFFIFLCSLLFLAGRRSSMISNKAGSPIVSTKSRCIELLLATDIGLLE